jgi:hypothetical protein
MTAGARRAIKEAFAKAVTRIFFYSMFAVVVSWLMTLFIPEIPLRNTRQRSAVAAAE